MTFATLLTATIASAALAAGVWLVIAGAVTIVTARETETGADRRHYQRVGAVMCTIGLAAFTAGTAVGLGVMA